MIFNRSFRVRNYECDANGHLNSINYLRWMQETAFDASAALGYDQARYSEIGHYWIIRETEIEYLRPLYYNDRVVVKTWVSDFRRVSSRRRYEFYLEGSDELYAQAFSDWVYLDAVRQSPASIPKSFAVACFPEGMPETFPLRQPFPKPPVPPPGKFSLRRKVNWQDLDPMQHVNNAVYMAYANECGFQAIAAFGWDWQRMKDEGLAILLRRCQFQYLEPALLDDELEIATWVSGVHRATATRHYTIRRERDQALLCQANMLAAWVDIKSGKPARIPAQFLKDFAPNISAES